MLLGISAISVRPRPWEFIGERGGAAVVDANIRSDGKKIFFDFMNEFKGRNRDLTNIFLFFIFTVLN